MIALTARLKGSLLPASQGGRVLSVHQTAINLIHSDSLTVSFVVSRDHMTDRTILLDRLPDRLRVGTSFDLDHHVLALGRSLRVDFTNTPHWSGAIESGCDTWSASELATALRHSLMKSGKPGGFLGLIDPRDRNPFASKAQIILDSEESLAALVGLGPGFTPSGDDFLTGVLLSSRLGIPGFLPPRIELPANGLSRTTAGGRTMLSLALRRSYPAYLTQLAASLGDAGGPSDIESAVWRATGFGETSGTDAMVGLLWSLSGGMVTAR